MELKNIKSLSEFYEVADIWYQRSHKIREVWQDENQPFPKRIKAYVIWLRLYEIVIKCSQIASEASQLPAPKNIKPGGFTTNPH